MSQVENASLPSGEGGEARDSELDEPGVMWRWLLTDEVGLEMAGPAVVFESQVAAEDWLRESFDELAADGVATVSLLNGGHAVYGPMYLTPEADGPVAEAEL